jgi:uncharacterized membrane protein YfcA
VSVLGGIAGGGGGFIMTPLAIFLGMSPAQAVATGKFAGLSVTLATLQRLRKEKLHSRRMVIPIMLLAAVIGLVAPVAIVKLDNEFYRNALGTMLLIMIPFVLLKKVGHEKRQVSDLSKAAGWVLLAVTMLIQGIFSGGMGTLVNLVLMSMMGMSALEATATKRFSQILLNGIIVVFVIGSGLIVWKVVIIGVITAFIGARIGTHVAIKKGNKFVSYVFVAFMLFAALELIFG